MPAADQNLREEQLQREQQERLAQLERELQREREEIEAQMRDEQRRLEVCCACTFWLGHMPMVPP